MDNSCSLNNNPKMRSNDLSNTAGGEDFVLISLVKEWYAPKKSRIYLTTFFALTLETFNIGDDLCILKNKYFFTIYLLIFFKMMNEIYSIKFRMKTHCRFLTFVFLLSVVDCVLNILSQHTQN